MTCTEFISVFMMRGLFKDFDGQKTLLIDIDNSKYNFSYKIHTSLPL